MAPEVTKKLVVLDLFVEGEQLFAARDVAECRDEFLVKWYPVETAPAGYQPVAGGVVFIPVGVPVNHEAKVAIRSTQRSCRYREKADMLVLLLPPGRAVTWYRRPSDAKEFNGRLALYWLCPSPDGPIDVVWNLPAAEADARKIAADLQAFLDDENEDLPTISIDNYAHYDVALSYASEDRKHAESIAQALKRAGKSVFFDHHDRSALMGKPLSSELDVIFAKRSTMCVLLASERYLGKEWTQVELAAALKAASRRPDHIVPVQLDDTRIPALPADIAYLPIRLGVDDICNEIVRRLDRS